jgi:hypothetical protein
MRKTFGQHSLHTSQRMQSLSSTTGRFMGVPGKMLIFRNCSGSEGSRVRGSGEKQLPGPDGHRPDSYMPEEVEDYGACPR